MPCLVLNCQRFQTMRNVHISGLSALLVVQTFCKASEFMSKALKRVTEVIYYECDRFTHIETDENEARIFICQEIKLQFGQILYFCVT